MSKRTKGFLIALFLGWCGGYRFYKKQFILGLLYFFTCGLFCFGWFWDIFVSLLPEKTNSNAPAANPPANLIASFHTKVVGVTYPCVQGGCETRQEALECIRHKDILYIEPFEYEGAPAFRVVLKRNYSDIGNLSAEVAKELSTKYAGCIYKIAEYEVTGGDGKKYGCNIKLEIYK